MPEWAGWVVAAVAAVSTAYVAVINASHKNRREQRADEIAVLYQSIDGLRKDRDQQDVIIGTLRDEYTAALVNLGTMQTRVSYMEQEIKELRAEHASCREEVQKLNDEISKLRSA